MDEFARQSYLPLSVPNLKGNELKYVTTAVQTEWVSTGGPYVSEFEQKFAQYVHARGAVSCQSGTAGLHIALMLMGVTRDDAVIVPTLTFIASVNPIKYCNAEPIFMDCDDSLCMDTEKLDRFFREECDYVDEVLVDRSSGRQIKAIMIVHVFGNLSNMEAIMKTAAHYNLKVIEDATEALGSYYQSGKYAGMYAGTIGDIGVYSFNGNKIITTGGGGMIVSENPDLLRHAKHLTTQAKSDELYYTHDEIGYNYRMTNLQAALGLAQFEQLESFIEAKHRNYQLYRDALQVIPGLRLLEFRILTRSNKWFYSLFVEDSFPMDRDELIKYLADNQIQTRPVWGLIHEQQPYHGARQYMIEKAKYYHEHIVNIPCSTNLTEAQITLVTACISEISA